MLGVQQQQNDFLGIYSKHGSNIDECEFTRTCVYNRTMRKDVVSLVESVLCFYWTQDRRVRS
jgi:hypothetical protein